MKPSGVKQLTLNGTTGKPDIARDLIRALNDHRIITEKGGFLFKAGFDQNQAHLILGFMPCILNGRRAYHYNSRLPGEDQYTLVGSITPNHVFEILFKPPSLTLTDDDRRKYALLYVTFARLLLEQGFHHRAPLSVITVQMLREAGLLTELPDDLAGLAGEPLQFDEDSE